MFKAIFATLLIAAITAVVVFFAMNPDRYADYVERGKALFTPCDCGDVTSDSQSTINELTKPEKTVSGLDEHTPAFLPRNADEALPAEVVVILPAPATSPGEQMVKAGEGDADVSLKKTLPLRLITEAEKILDSRLRDQAYLSIIDYGISIEDLNNTAPLADEIESDDYRFTAQSKIAIAFAHSGNDDAAFDMVGAIDDTEFADIVRMQVIETISNRNAPN